MGSGCDVILWEAHSDAARGLHSTTARRLNCFCRGAEDGTPNTVVSRQRPRPSVMLSEN